MKEVWWQKGLQVFFRLSVWIAAPVLGGVLLGRWLDQKFGSEPVLFLITIGLAFILSMFGLIKEALKEFQTLERANNQQTANNQQPGSLNKENKKD